MARKPAPDTPTDTTDLAALRRRIDQLVREATAFARLATEAKSKGEMTAAVNARKMHSELTARIDTARAALHAAQLEGVSRLDHLATRAAAEGSWVATAQLAARAAEERARIETNRANETLRLAAAAEGATDVEHLRWVLSELTHLASTCTGIAKVQALREAGKVKLALDVAIKAAEGKGASTDEEVIAEIRAQLPDIPDLHLVEFVQEYCRRHNLPMPHRAIVGGRAAN